MLLAIFMPLSLLVLWNNQAIDDPELKKMLLQISKENQIQELGFRYWHTGHQLPNAAVVGFIPRLRLVFLSDALLSRFPFNEIEAIVRHEAAHIQLRHAIWRMGFMCLPIFAAMFHQTHLVQLESFQFRISQGQEDLTVTVAPVWVAFLLSVVVIGWISNRWLNHQLEFQADIYSTEPPPSKRNRSFFRLEDKNALSSRTEAMKMALLRFAAMSEYHWRRATFFHPSIQSRIELLNCVESNSSSMAEFHRAFQRKRWIYLGFWITLCGIGLMK
jgi:Zn-dependent protease with chaperone function